MTGLVRIPLAAACLAAAALAPIGVAMVGPAPAMAQSVTTAPPPPADLSLALRRITELETALRDANVAADEASREVFRLRLENQRLKEALATAQQAAQMADGAAPLSPTPPPATAPISTPSAPTRTTLPVPPAPTPPAIAAPNETDDYNKAIALVTTDPAGAERALAAFRTNYPNSPRLGDATYFIGRTQYVQSKWSAAAGTFLDIVERTPRAPRAPEALVWLGSAIRADGAASGDAAKVRTGCDLMRELSRRFPSASDRVKQLAQQELARTSGGQPMCPRT